MVKKKVVKKSLKKDSKKKKIIKKQKKNFSKKSTNKFSKKFKKKVLEKKIPTLNLKTDHEIALDFATKTYKKFDKLIKSIILFGSVEKKNISLGSDIDIIVIIDDIAINWDQELIAFYREELDLLLQGNPYKGSLHINTIKLSTWWDDLLKGDPVVLNIIRTGFPIIDRGGFIEPLKHLMVRGKIKGTPEAIYQCLQRAPGHLARSKAAELAAVDGLYWAMVDSAHAALIAAGYFPPSPEHVSIDLKEAFVDKKILKMKYVLWYRDLYNLHKKIDHKEISDIKGIDIDAWQEKAEEFMKVMINLVEMIVRKS